MEDTQDIRGNKVARECDEQLSKPVGTARYQQTTNPHVTLYMRARDFKVLSEMVKL